MPLTGFNESTLGSSSVPATWTHTVSSGSNRILDILFMSRGTIVGTLTYNGDAFTKLKEYFFDTGLRVTHYRLINPDVGASQTIAFSNDDTIRFLAYAYSYSDADSTTPTYQEDGSNSSGSSSSLNVTIAADEVAISCLAVWDDANACTITVGADQVTEVNTHYQGTSIGVEGAVSTETGAGTKTMSYTWSPTDSHAHIAYAIKPFAAAAAIETFYRSRQVLVRR